MPDLKPQAGTCTGLVEGSAPAPPVGIYSAETDSTWILTTVSHQDKKTSCEDGISAEAREKRSVEYENKLYASYSWWSETSKWESWLGPHMNFAPR